MKLALICVLVISSVAAFGGSCNNAPAGPTLYPVTEKAHVYYDGETGLDGLLMTPDVPNAKDLPGLLVFPYFMGQNSADINDLARTYAQRGMVVFIADYYGKKYDDTNPAHIGEALTVTYPNFVKDTETAGRIALLSLKQLTDQPNVDPEKIGVFGFCMGGTMGGVFARAGGKAAVVISLHGYNQLPEDATPVTADNGYNIKYFASFFGRNDPTIPPAIVEGSSVWLDEATKNGSAGGWEVVSYSGAVHSFSVPMNPVVYTFLESVGYGGAAEYNEDRAKAAFARADDLFKQFGLLK